MRKLLSMATVSVALTVTPLSAQDLPAALVIRLEGDVQVRRADAEPAPAVVGEHLSAGDEVLPASGARALLITRTGATQRVTEPTTVSEPRGGGNTDMFDRAMRTLAQAATADARSALGRQGMIRPIPGEPVLVAPRNGLIVTDTRPTFSWMPVEGAAGYTIQLRRVDPPGQRPMRFPVGAVSEWTLPDSVAELTAGGEYAWTVAPSAGRPTREQRFMAIDANTRLEVDGYIQQVREMGLDPESDGLFLTAMIFRDMDLFYDAERALDLLEGSGDMSAELYLLKGEILGSLGRGDEATEAFNRADEIMR